MMVMLFRFMGEAEPLRNMRGRLAGPAFAADSPRMSDNTRLPNSQISRADMFVPLLEADPSFSNRWHAFVEEWRDEPDELPQYLALFDLARHLIGRLEAGDVAGFDTVFDVVERWHLEGDDYVREAASIGLLEDLQNGYLHKTTEPSDFEKWLRPTSRIWWDKLIAYWEGRGSLK
jgi:hypothetical protein